MEDLALRFATMAVVAIRAGDGDAEGGKGGAVAGVFEFRVSRQVAKLDTFVVASGAHGFLLRGERRGQVAPGWYARWSH